MTAQSIAGALAAGSRRLAGAGIDTAALDARILLEAATGFSREALVLRGDEPLPAGASQSYDAMLIAREAGKPVSRIIGTREFWGLNFRVSPATLDPRPDTETLVQAVLDRLAPDARPVILDLGTGSGAILVSLLHALPGARGTGIDVSSAALRMARTNAAAAGVADRAGFVLSDWAAMPVRRGDVIVSNPPYIARGELPALMGDVRHFDPPRALDGGADGLASYRAIAAALPRIARPGALVVFETGYRQAKSVVDILSGAGCATRGRDLGVVKDLAGRDRVVVARAPRL